MKLTKKELEYVAHQIDTDLQQVETNAQFMEIKNNILQEIKISAQRYQIFMTTAIQYVEYFEMTLKEMRSIRDRKQKTKQIEKLYAKYERQRKNFLNSSLALRILKETEKFQQDLFLFLNQQLKTVYSYQGKFYEISNIPLEKIVKTEYSSANKFRGLYNSSALQKLIKLNKLPEINFNKNVTPVYQEVLKRYIASKNKVVFWQDNQKINVQSVQSQGSIEEAYANLAISQTIKFSSSGWTEKDIGIFVKEGIMQVDNTSGRLKGDFSIGNIEYAIKSLDASMVSIKQFIPLANLILSDTFNIEQLQKIKQQDEDKSIKINALDTILTEELNNLISNYFNNK